MLTFKSHPYLPGHNIAKYKGFSVLEGPYCIGGGGWEVMTPDGEVHGRNSLDAILEVIKVYQ